MKISVLREERNEIKRQMSDLHAKNSGKTWGVAQQNSYDSLLGKFERLDNEISGMEHAADRDRDSRIDDTIDHAKRGRSGETYQVYDAFIRKGLEGLSAEQAKVFRNTLSTTTGSQGGFSVPTLVAQQIFDVQKQYSSMRSVCGSLITTTGANMNVPSSDGTGETGEITAQNASSSASDPSFASVSINTFKYDGKIVAVPFELLQDNVVNLDDFILNRSTARIGRLSNTGFTNGDGSTAPQGVVGVATLGKVGTTGETLTIIVDDVVDLFHAVDPGYRNNGTWMASDTMVKVLRKVKDTAGQPIFLNGDSIAPPSLLGRPLVVNNDMPVPAANAKSLLFGDFSRYLIRDALDVQMLRFTDSVYVKLGQVGFQAISRAGGQLADVAAIKYFQHSAT
jgi:HK97 family phage major capsid protein